MKKGLLLPVFIFLFAAACGKSEQQSGFEQSRMEMREEINKTIANIDKRITGMRDQMAQATEEERQDIQDQIGKLEQSRKNLANRMEELRTATEEKWDEFRQETADMLNDVEQELRG